MKYLKNLWRTSNNCYDALYSSLRNSNHYNIMVAVSFFAAYIFNLLYKIRDTRMYDLNSGIVKLFFPLKQNT